MPVAIDPADLGAAVRAQRRALGWTQAHLAALAGTSRQWVSGFEQGRERAELGMTLRVVEALGLSIATAVIAPVVDAGAWLTAASVARAIRQELEDGDATFAMRLLGQAVAELRALRDPDAIAAFLAPPPSTGDPRWDTLLAAAISRECRHRGFPIPNWTRVPPLRTFWFPDDDPILTARTMQRTPLDLRNKGIWLDARALETA
ncbi:MAG: helix-turn-helix domain-containing protein [Acidimicrobiales bacterium]